MKIMHLSDLHIGKKLNGFSLLEDQQYIHQQLLQIARQEAVDAVVIAGDIFDKAMPSAAAVQLFDDFLSAWAALKLPVLLISGNHDSAERIAFGHQLFARSNVYISPVYNGKIESVALNDEWGTVNFYLLPFIKPSAVRPFFPKEDINSYNKAVAAVLRDLPLAKAQRNILVAHQFVTGAHCCDSEEIIVGGLDNIDAALFNDFDYAALGHIHTPQAVGRDTIRYCGTALKYSFSEAEQTKSVTIVELAAKGQINITEHELQPLRDLRKIKGTYAQLTDRSSYINSAVEDYLAVTLTDEQEIPEAIARLRSIYPNIMQLTYDNARTRTHNQLQIQDITDVQTPLELFAEFYQQQNNQGLNANQQQLLQELIDTIWEENSCDR